jgi:uncharacterized protein (DUF488 family)
VTLYTIGHSNRTAEDFRTLLRANGVEAVADVRQFPHSRHNPQFNKETLERDLGEAGYVHIVQLGGRRGSRLENSPNTLWENTAFRNYADYALGGAFETGLAKLIALGAIRATSMMCAEAVWWRCHRRIVTDYLLARGHAVLHILGNAEPKAASLTPGAQIRGDGKVVYPAAHASLPL